MLQVQKDNFSCEVHCHLVQFILDLLILRTPIQMFWCYNMVFDISFSTTTNNTPTSLDGSTLLDVVRKQFQLLFIPQNREISNRQMFCYKTRKTCSNLIL